MTPSTPEEEIDRKLDYIQSMIWARINDEANLRKIKLTAGDCYALGSVIKEVLHPEVNSLLVRSRKSEAELLERRCREASERMMKAAGVSVYPEGTFPHNTIFKERIASLQAEETQK